MSENEFERIFSKRTVICFFTVAVLFFGCILRVAAAAMSDYSKVAEIQSSYRLTAGKLRGTIYDRNMVPITNTDKKIIAAVSPTPRAVTALSSILTGSELENVLERLKSGKPVLCEVPEIIECDGIEYTQVYEHADADTPAIHIVGYTDSDSHGVSGIEKAYDSLLYSEKEASFVYTIDGQGGILSGIKPEIENDSSVTAGGVVSTLDVNIQAIAESAAENIETGAVVVAEAESLKLLASVSRPDFDCTDISNFLDKKDSPLLNRALAAFNVGSVFKPCVAAAGIEAGKGDFLYTCTGGCRIIDRYFKCHNRSGHGLMSLESGLANSCNTFFYNFAFKIGGEAVYNMASSLNFGTGLKICDGINTADGALPDKESLSNIAQLANFSIGQGTLSVAPISMLTLYGAIAGDGSYTVPSLIEGTLTDGKLTEYKKDRPTRVMNPDTAEILRKYLASVISEGTGASAMPKNVTAAGKTATAQTGKYENGVEICEGWFCGFFPADKPKYVVVVFSENIKRQSKSCGELFAEIADGITELDA